jgi:hypothetical protein
VPIGFCCGGFSSTGGYVPANEACVPKHSSDFCSFSVVPCQKVFFVFIRKTPKDFSIFPEQSLSASIQGVNSNFFPSFVTLKQCVTALPASPCIGQKPVSIFDCIWILHLFFLLSSRKYFRFCPYFIGISHIICGKDLHLAVEKSVENFVTLLIE